MTNSELFMTPNEQEAAIKEGGFSTVERLMVKNGLGSFWSARLKPTQNVTL